MCKLCQFREGFFKRQWPPLVWGMGASASPQVWTSDQQLTLCGVSLSLCIGLNSRRTGVCAEVTLACGCLEISLKVEHTLAWLSGPHISAKFSEL